MKLLSFLNYLLLIAIITVIILLIYASVQQTYRSGANDPQIQIAEDISAKIQKGKFIEDIFPDDTIDIAQSLAPVVALYDAQGKPLRSSGFLDGKMLQLPAGVFDFAKKCGSHSVTWQPEHDVRMAMVLVHVNSSLVQFVAAGRSLREVEIREQRLITMVSFSWLICIALVLLHAALQYFKNLKFSEKPGLKRMAST